MVYSMFAKESDGKVIILPIYVDDLLIKGGDDQGIIELKEYLSLMFQIKDLGTLKCFMGIEVARSKRGTCLNQRKYAWS